MLSSFCRPDRSSEGSLDGVVRYELLVLLWMQVYMF